METEILDIIQEDFEEQQRLDGTDYEDEGVQEKVNNYSIEVGKVILEGIKL